MIRISKIPLLVSLIVLLSAREGAHSSIKYGKRYERRKHSLVSSRGGGKVPLSCLVNVHHLIPRSCEDHPNLKGKSFSVHDRRNLILLPTTTGSKLLRIHEDRPVHNTSHMGYNTYVRSRLDFVDTKEDLSSFLSFLKRNMRHRDSVPW